MAYLFNMGIAPPIGYVVSKLVESSVPRARQSKDGASAANIDISKPALQSAGWTECQVWVDRVTSTAPHASRLHRQRTFSDQRYMYRDRRNARGARYATARIELSGTSNE